MLRQVRSHGLDIDAHQRAELQLWLVHKRLYARAETDCIPSSATAFTNLFSSIVTLYYSLSILIITLKSCVPVVRDCVAHALISYVNSNNNMAEEKHRFQHFFHEEIRNKHFNESTQHPKILSRQIRRQHKYYKNF